jgi:hypothetical protein
MLLMIRKTFLVVIAVMLLGLTAYASSLMVKVERSITPKPDQALIVFMRSSSLGSAISASIFDVSGDETKFIGIIRNGTKISYDIAPGEYTFMVISESADFMKATVSAGKTYYALVTPRMGAWKARFSFKPLRQADLVSTNFLKWDSKTYVVDNTPASEAWATKNAADITTKRVRYWPAWLALSPQLQDSMTLNLEDGR